MKNMAEKNFPKKLVEVALPIPTEKTFYYSVPEELIDLAQVGVRAVAPIGKRVLTGFIINVIDEKSFEKELKEIHIKELKEIEDILDPIPFFDEKFLAFARWVADYYFSSLGEVLDAAVPAGTDVESKKIVVVDPNVIFEEIKNTDLKRTNYLKLLRILAEKEEHTLSEIKKKLKKEGIQSNINYYLSKLEKKGLASIFIEKRKPIVKVKKEKVVELGDLSFEEFSEVLSKLEKRSIKQFNVLLTLFASKEKKMKQTELIEKAKANSQIIKALAKKKLVKITEVEVKREYVELYSEQQKQITLNEDQQKAIELISKSIEKNQFDIFLIHGVTGSGKTQIYLELIEKVINQNKTALYLVPEISLTPQVIRRIKNRFGDLVGVLHSKLSPGERFDEWRSVIKGEYKIVVGPRSAVFAPLKNIGIVIIDEEHDSSYKQSENAPYYHGRDSALIRAKIENAVVVLGSATPSIETYFNALSGKYHLIELKKRIDNAQLPIISLIDLKSEREENRMIGSFSQTMIDKIKNAISRNEKVIILQNRRGFATYVMCPSCGYIEQCKNCSVTLTYHLITKEYICHYCNYSKKELATCPVCGSKEIKYKGIGTQRVEDELEQIIPGSRIARMDLDTTQKKYSFSRILNDFGEGKYNILLGTQMVAKGLDFPDVTFVGVVSAESTMLIPDFRSGEKTFQLLSQVAGRAGRSNLQGEVAIQTFRPDSYILQHVQKHDYQGFYSNEIIHREQAKYPPFYKLALIEFKSTNINQVKRASKEFHRFLKFDNSIIEVLGPAPAYISKIAGKYRWHILIKSNRAYDPNGSYLHKVIRKALKDFQTIKKISGVKLIIDIDPISTI
ncbi:MAG: primosomal protein N' [Ignavibacteria bacterium]|nr:primosomal protein N' [Ignavibacteria bacterium]